MAKKEQPQITSKQNYLNRKEFLKAVGIAGTSAAVLAACQGKPFVPGGDLPQATGIPGPAPGADGAADELGNALTNYEDVISYNNFYEFTTDKEGVARLAKDFQTSPWEVQIDGLVENPGPISMEEIRDRYPTEERIYRMRCVEGWSMVIPWQGFTLGALLEDLKPKPSAKYVRFESIYDPKTLPGQGNHYSNRKTHPGQTAGSTKRC